jgi:very-short-patch-repair endonuclease
MTARRSLTARVARDGVRMLGTGATQQARNNDLAGVRSHKTAGSGLESYLLLSMRASGLPEPEQQFKFCPTRRWRADFAFPAARLLVEVDGGAYVGGRHTRGAGFEADCEKASTAAALGWRVIRVTGRMVKSGQATALIADALAHSTGAQGKLGRGEG